MELGREFLWLLMNLREIFRGIYGRKYAVYFSSKQIKVFMLFRWNTFNLNISDDVVMHIFRFELGLYIQQSNSNPSQSSFILKLPDT